MDLWKRFSGTHRNAEPYYGWGIFTTNQKTVDEDNQTGNNTENDWAISEGVEAKTN